MATPSNTASPLVSPTPSSAPLTGAGETDLDVAKRIEGEVDRLSEIQKTVALVTNKKAVIAVEFDSAYKGAMTSRIKEMIIERAKLVDSALTEISVTDDPAMLTEIHDLRARVDGGNLVDDIRAEFDKLIQRLKPTV